MAGQADALSTTETRRFSGQRYVSGRGVQVFRTTTEQSAVVYDVPPNVIIYAEPTDKPGWLAIRGVGSRQIRVRQASPQVTNKQASVTLLSNGRLSFVQGADFEKYYEIYGYIARTGVRRYEDLPGDLSNITRPVNQPFEGLGVADSRRFASSYRHPFDAIARLVVSFRNLESACTAFFIIDTITLLSNKHCFSDENFKDLGTNVPFRIEIQRSANDLERLEGSVIASGKEGGGPEDWVVIRLKQPPVHSVTPLRFADPKLWLMSGRAKAIDIGYPGDLRASSIFELGFEAPSLVSCDIDVAFSGLIAEGALTAQVMTCPIWYGNSGSPLMIYDEADQCYKVIGIQTRGWTRNWSQTRGTETLSDDVVSAVRNKVADEVTRINMRNAAEVASSISKTATWNEEAPNIGALWAAINDDRDDALHLAYLSPELLSVLRSRFGATVYLPGGDESYPRLDRKSNYLNGSLDIGYDQWVGCTIFSQDCGVSDLISTEDRLSVFRTSDDQELPSRRLLAEVRVLCAYACAKESLDPQFQIKSGYGSTLSPKKIIADKIPFQFYSYAKLPTDTQRALVGKSRADQNPGLLIIGGDLFIVDSRGRDVSWIVRNFMNTAPDGLLGPVREMDPDCSAPQRPDDAPALWTEDTDGLASVMDGFTPRDVAGASTISTRQAACLLKSGRRPIVLSVLNDSLGLPGAYGVNWAGLWGPSVRDPIAEKLAQSVRGLPGGADGRPILVYCRDNSCWLSVNVVKRLVAMGFNQVFWLRDGVNGWMRQGGRLETARLIPSPMGPGEVTAAPARQPIPRDTWNRVATLNGIAAATFPGEYLNAAKTRRADGRTFTDYFVTSLSGSVGGTNFSLKALEFSGNKPPIKIGLDDVFLRKSVEGVIDGQRVHVYQEHENGFSISWIGLVTGSYVVSLYVQVADKDAGVAEGRLKADRFANSLELPRADPPK